jgi:uncharacterized repeat protein (TIGR04076 family)
LTEQRKYKIISEVAYIGALGGGEGKCPVYKVGDKIVWNGSVLNLQETDAVCLMALYSYNWHHIWEKGDDLIYKIIAQDQRESWHGCPMPGDPYTPCGRVIFKDRRVPLNEIRIEEKKAEKRHYKYKVFVDVVEIQGSCPAFAVGDRLVFDGGIMWDESRIKKNFEGITKLCSYTMDTLVPFTTALNAGIAPVELGLAKSGDDGYALCQACTYMVPSTVHEKFGTNPGHGIVLFRLRREPIEKRAADRYYEWALKEELPGGVSVKY